MTDPLAPAPQDPLGAGAPPDPLAPPPAQGVVIAPVPAHQRIVKFNPESGVPEVTTAPMVTRSQVNDAITAALALPYEPDPRIVGDEAFRGMTNLEVMMRKRARLAARTGEDGPSESLLDRMMGKPKTTSENLSVSVDYVAYLKSLAEKTVSAAARGPIDAQVVK